MTKSPEKHLTPDEASAYLHDTYGIRRTKKTLQALRYHGGGPVYCRLSAKEILYPVSALDAWATEKLGDTFENNAQEYGTRKSRRPSGILKLPTVNASAGEKQAALENRVAGIKRAAAARRATKQAKQARADEHIHAEAISEAIDQEKKDAAEEN